MSPVSDSEAITGSETTSANSQLLERYVSIKDFAADDSTTLQHKA